MKAAARVQMLAWGLVSAVILSVALPRIATLYEPYTFLLGDCPYYAATAISVLTDRDLDLKNQVRGGPAVHNRQLSMGLRGEWYPKHPILMPLLTAPLLPVFGMNGCLIFNVWVLLGLGIVLYEISARAARPAAAAIGTLATILGSFLILYDYNYSPDLFACLVLALTVLAAVRGAPATSGLLAGLAALARTSNLFLLPILLAYVAWKRRLRGAALFAAMAALPLLAQAALNFEMFGSPFVSPYTRIISIEDGVMVIRSHMNDFDNPFTEGILGQLFDQRKGLVFTAPILVAAIPGFLLWFRKRRDEALLCFVVGEFLFLLFSRYRWWPTSHVGNRFLMPLVALSAPAVACTVEWAWEWLRAKRWLRSREPAPG